MLIETITDSVYDTEICVTCPTCNGSTYFDPRPWHHCGDCMATRVIDFIRTCGKCGPSEAKGDVQWLLVCTPVEKEEYDKLKNLPTDEQRPIIDRLCNRNAMPVRGREFKFK